QQFDIELVSVTHSIPESNALIIRTRLGNVLHTGDWKLDPAPVIGSPTDVPKLQALGAGGCLAPVRGSTNAHPSPPSPPHRAHAPSALCVSTPLCELVKSARQPVAVTTFASNVARIRAVADAARAVGREVVVVGRAMERVVQVARETGYLDGVQDFRPQDAYG